MSDFAQFEMQTVLKVKEIFKFKNFSALIQGVNRIMEFFKANFPELGSGVSVFYFNLHNFLTTMVGRHIVYMIQIKNDRQFSK